MTKRNHPVFFDPSKKRSKISKRVILLISTFVCILGSIFLASIFFHPILPLPEIFHNLAFNHHFHKSSKFSSTQRPTHVPHEKGSHVSITGSVLDPQNRNIYAFGVEWDDASFASLQAHMSSIDTLIMEEMTLSDSGVSLINPEKFQRTLTYIRQNNENLPIVPLINNYNQSQNFWDSKKLFSILSDTSKRSNLEKGIMDFVSQNRLGGVNIDFEEVDEATFPYYLNFLEEITNSIHAIGGKVSVNVPMSNDTFDLSEIEKRVDGVILMAYDEHWSSADPGPIASQDWFIDGVTAALNEVPKEKLIVALGNYGYDWMIGKKQSTALTFQEAHTIMRESDENVEFDTGSLNPMYTYSDDDNKDHEVWYLDGVTFYNQLSALSTLGISNTALWRLGSEDPSIWDIYKKPISSNVTSSLKQFGYGYEIDYEGTGEFYKLQSSPKVGTRTITTSGSIISNEYITDFPLPYVIARYGDIQDKKILLTFDDGPDPNTTPKILDILKKEKVPATFFVIGSNAEQYPLLTKRIYDEGHILGNHSFSHPDIARVGQTRVNIELTSTERIIESIIHHKSILFRPPYGEDIEPEIPSQVTPLLESNALGYITVGMKIDPSDWANPGVSTIVDRVVEQAKSKKGNIVLLHDSGGDRQETIEALPEIIHRLKNLGFTFVSANNLLGVTRDTIMPLDVGKDATITDINSTSFWVWSFFSWLFYYVFFATLLFGIIRFFIVLFFACTQKFHITKTRTYNSDFSPTVSVIVPAYNEGKVITKTIDSLLGSHYKTFDIIVVDDGSTDNTVDVITKKFGNNPKVKIFTKPNSGKGETINYGITHTDAKIIIVIDADTIFHTDTISFLARHFEDDQVGAVSGNVKVGNRENFLTHLQSVEYITSQNIDRRAYDAMGAITVVPGAVGAWRRDLIMLIGGFSPETLAEDSDMTISLLRLGYRVEHEEFAYAYTEAPNTWKAFKKQRFRWTFGVLQVTWKHFDGFFDVQSPKILRYFIFPNFIIFQLIVPLIAPIVDFFALLSIFLTTMNYFLYDSLVYFHSLLAVLGYMVVFMLLDVLIACIAFFFEREEPFRNFLYFIPQRILYRFFMHYINLKSLWNALKGSLVGWNKLERTGGVMK